MPVAVGLLGTLAEFDSVQRPVDHSIPRPPLWGSKMLRILLPSCAFNRRFQKMELTTAPALPCHSLFPRGCAEIRLWREVGASQAQSLGFENVLFHVVPFSVFMWLESHPGRVSVACPEKPAPRRTEAGGVVAPSPLAGAPERGVGWREPGFLTNPSVGWCQSHA